MKTIKLYKKYKRLDDGGIPPNEKFAQSVGYGNSALQVANTGNQMFGEQGNEFGVKSNSGAILGGGLQGAAAGAAIGSAIPGVGTLIGGAIGGTIGIIKSNQSNNEAKRREEDYKNQQKQLFLQNQQNSFNQVLNNGFQVQGNMNAQKYAKNGGLLSIMYKNGGNVQQLSKTNVQFNGNSHENGGIKEPLVNGVRLDGTEVEGNESMSTSNGQKFVFSENLGFAQQHKPLARAMGKIEKKLKSNPNDPISKRTLNTLKEREEQLKIKQEETKEALGLENNLGEMKNGGLYKKMGGGGKYVNDGTNQSYTDASGTYAITGKNNTLRYKGLKDKDFRTINDPNGIAAINKLNPSFQYTPNAVASTSNNAPTPILRSELSQTPQYVIGSPRPDNNDPEISGLGTSNMSKYAESPTQGVGKVSSNTPGSRVNWGNVAGKIIPYAGVASNYMLNEQARRMTTPKEALPDYVKYKPVDYSASKIEADQQRRQLNKSLTQNVTNSAVAAALKAKNLGTTIGAKNLINQEEMNVNTQGINQNNLVNNQIQQRRNQIDVENRDRDYNKEQRYLTQKGEIANNFSDIYQQQGRDTKLYDLEDRKIDVLAKQDAARDVWYRNFLEDQKKQKESHKNGGLLKKSSKLYSKMKK